MASDFTRSGKNAVDEDGPVKGGGRIEEGIGGCGPRKGEQCCHGFDICGIFGCTIGGRIADADITGVRPEDWGPERARSSKIFSHDALKLRELLHCRLSSLS